MSPPSPFIPSPPFPLPPPPHTRNIYSPLQASPHYCFFSPLISPVIIQAQMNSSPSCPSSLSQSNTRNREPWPPRAPFSCLSSLAISPPSSIYGQLACCWPKGKSLECCETVVHIPPSCPSSHSGTCKISWPSGPAHYHARL